MRVYSTDIVESARENMLRSLSSNNVNLPNAGPRWAGFAIEFRDAAARLKTPAEVVHYIQALQGGIESRHGGEDLISHATTLDASLRAEFPALSSHVSEFGEVSFALAETTTSIAGRSVSEPVLFHAWTIFRCVSHLLPKTILDIGGGIGSAGRLWLTNPIHRPDSYIDLDLPESLFFAEVYLRTAFPDLKITYVHDQGDLSAGFRSGSHVFLIPVHNFKLLSQFLDIDLVVNTGSMQEMSTEYIDFYMALIDNLNAKYFYSNNYFAQNIESLFESGNFAAPTMGKNWKSIFRKWHYHPHSGHAEILFERETNSSEPIRSFLTETISNVEIFLEAFDVVRRIDDPNVLMAFVRKTRQELSFVPKELLWLVRRAHNLDPQSASIDVELRQLERMAAKNVGSALEKEAFGISDELLRPVEVGVAVQRMGTKCCISVSDKAVELISSGGADHITVGAVEGFTPTPPTAWGWAVDPTAGGSAQVIFIGDNRVLAWGKPVHYRADIAAGWGFGFDRCGFTIQIPDACLADLRRTRAYAILSNGTAHELDYAPNLRRED